MRIYLPAAIEGTTIASPEHAVEPAEDSGSDHSDAQAGDAEKEDSSIQSSPISRGKTQLSDTPAKDNFIFDSDGSETALNQRLSKNVNSIQRKKNREERLLAEKAIRDAKPLPVVLVDAKKVGGIRKRRRTKKRITKEGGCPEKHS